MNNRVAGLINEWEGVAPEDLVLALQEQAQAMKEITEINWKLTFERDLAQREADHYKARCVKFQMDEKRRLHAGGEIK
ncbi:hypothetical protein MHB43_10265 [Paenibacillus sp. FSL H8-0317]|uniref:hypothetical protein n=1 Tax=Paenibacillus sp. FSL H8-0317 TaxID=2921385 RepID=UPI0032473063